MRGPLLPGLLLTFRPATHTPPGQGKPQTRNRNQRRRKALQYRKAAENGLLASSPNTPLPVEIPHVNGVSEGRTTQQEIVVPGAVANRNKKKGFLKDMAGLLRTKTTFSSDPQNANEEGGAADQAINGDAPSHRAGGTWTHIVPPSEQKGLPSNVFVSTQEFTAPRRNQYKPQDKVVANGSGSPLTEIQEEVQGGLVERIADANTEAETINSPVEETRAAQEDPVDLAWSKIDVALDVLDNLDASTWQENKLGTIIAWKVSFMCDLSKMQLMNQEVVLDQTTFTPELRLQLAKVIAVEDGLKMEKLVRPEPVYDDYGEYYGIDEEQGPMDVEKEIVQLSPRELTSGQGSWKVVPEMMAVGLIPE